MKTLKISSGIIMPAVLFFFLFGENHYLMAQNAKQEDISPSPQKRTVVTIIELDDDVDIQYDSAAPREWSDIDISKLQMNALEDLPDEIRQMLEEGHIKVFMDEDMDMEDFEKQMADMHEDIEFQLENGMAGVKQEIIQIRRNADGTLDTVVLMSDNIGPVKPLKDVDIGRIQDLKEEEGSITEEQVQEIEWKDDQGATRKVSIKKIKVLLVDTDKKEEEMLKENARKQGERPVVKDLRINRLNFYPNPNDGRFTLSFDVPEKGNTDVTILDVNGKGVFAEKLSGFEGNYQRTIDISDSGKGIYLLQIRQGNKGLNKKIILQ